MSKPSIFFNSENQGEFFKKFVLTPLQKNTSNVHPLPNNAKMSFSKRRSVLPNNKIMPSNGAGRNNKSKKNNNKSKKIKKKKNKSQKIEKRKRRI